MFRFVTHTVYLITLLFFVAREVPFCFSMITFEIIRIFEKEVQF